MTAPAQTCVPLRIFVAGATGVIGVRLLPLLVDRGHQVAGMTRTYARLETIRTLGAEPVLCDVFDTDALRQEVVAFGPDVLIDQLTDLPDEASRIKEFAAANNRIRRDGIRHLLDAARAAGVSRVLSQSVAWPLGGEGQAASEEHERLVLEAGGVVLRYGQLYGPGTYYEHALPSAPRVHVDEAARRTVEALNAAPGSVEVIVEA